MANFFDKVVTGLNKGVTTVSEGSRLIVEKAKLNTKLDDVKEKKNKVLNELGGIVYSMHLKGEITIEKCRNIFNEIAELDKNIEDINMQIKAIEAQKETQPAAETKRCPSCGAANKATAKFCASCGKSMLETDQETKVEPVEANVKEDEGAE